MRISDALVEKLLTTNQKVTAEQLQALHEQEASEKKPLQDLVIAGNIVSENDLTKLYAQEIELPFEDLNPKEINPEILREIPERIARQYGVVLFRQEPDGSKLLAMEDPDDIQALSFLHKHLGNKLTVYVATH